MDECRWGNPAAFFVFGIAYTARCVKTLAGILLAAVAFGGARVARSVAKEQHVTSVSSPYAPSPAAVPFLSLGYRELMADLLFVRLRTYFGGYAHDAKTIATMVEATVAADPQFRRVYDFGARVMTLARTGVDTDIYLRAIRVLERGRAEFPTEWRFPYLEGQIYTQDLQTNDPAQRRSWDETGTLLVESATRKPGAPASAAEWAAMMRTKFGQVDRAVEGLREILLITDDASARQALLDRLASLQKENAFALAAEVAEMRGRFDRAWKRDRPFLPATFYILIGPRVTDGFDPASLATGGRDVVGSQEHQVLEPLE